jgi:hypothetical protein
MAALSAELRSMGFRWGSYSNEAGCKVSACNTTELNASKYRGFVDEDFDLMVNTWHSDYIMVDSVGALERTFSLRYCACLPPSCNSLVIYHRERAALP